MAQLLAVDERSSLIKRVFTANNTRMQRIVPPTAGDPNRLISIAFATISLNSDLVTCTPESLFGGVLETLKLGLTIGGPAQESWLIPFKNKGVKEAVLVIGYQGFRTLIDRSRAVIDLHPRAVYANDLFDFEFGSNPRVQHRPYWKVGQATPGEFVAAYAVARLRGGGVQLEVMPKEEIDQHRARSRAASSGSSPWHTDYVPMALKTTIRKIAKYLPKASFELARALELDEKADLGVPQEFDLTDMTLPAQTVTPSTPIMQQLTDSLRERTAPQTDDAS